MKMDIIEVESTKNIVYSEDGWGANFVVQNFKWDELLSSPKSKDEKEVKNNCQHIVDEDDFNMKPDIVIADLINEFRLGDDRKVISPPKTSTNEREIPSRNEESEKESWSIIINDIWTQESCSSSWIVLIDIPMRIDKSTVRALCSQHGNLQYFGYFEKDGIAVCKYEAFLDARKAQRSLHQCILNEKPIKVESPCEQEIQLILKHLGVKENISEIIVEKL